MKKTFLFLVVNALIAWAVLRLPERAHAPTNGTTNANLLLVEEGRAYDLLVLGSSHGRALSRGGNHELLERALGRRILNLSKGGGCGGPVPARLYLDYFLARRNEARTVLYLIDPWVLYSAHWNERCDLFTDEPLRAEFFRLAAKAGVGTAPLVHYVTSKLRPGWIFREALPEALDRRVVKTIPPAGALYEKAYPSGRDAAIFTRYAAEVEALAEAARRAGLDLVFVLPPTLLGKIPGRDELVSLLRRLSRDGGARWFDFSSAIADRRLFADADHLNSEGVRWFAREILDVAISKRRDFRARRAPAARAIGKKTG